jgi:hypothetical protein
LWVIVALASLVVLILLLLCIPLDLAFRTNLDRKPRFVLKLVWLFGLLRHESRPEKKKRTVDTRRGARWVNQVEIAFDILRIRGFLRRLVSLISKIRRQVRIREFAANLKVALDNPADTGLLFAFLAPINVLGYIRPHEISIQPSFAGDSLLQGYVYGAVRLRPIQLFPPLITFAFSLPALRAAGKLVSYKWRRRVSPSPAPSP